MVKPWMRVAAMVLGLATAPLARAFDGPVEKKVFTIPSFTTVGGRTIHDVRIGYESYGTLNAAGTNAIFVALEQHGVPTELFVIPGDGGHLDGVTDIAKAGDAIRAFLAK